MKRCVNTWLARLLPSVEVSALSRADASAVRHWCMMNGFRPERVGACKFPDWASFKAALEGVSIPDDVPVLQPDSGGVIVLLGTRPGSRITKDWPW